MDDHDTRLEKLEAEVESMRAVIARLLQDLEERQSIYAMLSGRLN
jgi:hypothetical protein